MTLTLLLLSTGLHESFDDNTNWITKKVEKRKNQVELLLIIGIIIYLAIGVGTMVWIQRDNEFRYAEGAAIFAYGSIVLWPVMALLWYYLRPSEQIQDLAAAKSHADFKRFMRERKRSEGDLLSRLDKKTSPDEPLELGREPAFRDYHLEELIESGNLNEAMRTANDMLRFAREQQEQDRVAAYQRYINKIMDKRREEMNQS